MARRIGNSIKSRIRQRMLIEREIRNILSRDTVEGQRVLDELGKVLADLAYANFLKKSQGKIGDDGIKWLPTKKGQPLMVDTEKLLQSIEYVIRGTGVDVHFRIFPPENSDDAGRLIAVKKRPPFPEVIPQVWLDKLKRRLRELIVEGLQRRSYLRTQ